MTSKKTLQRRIFSEPFQIRTNSDGTIGVRGYAAVFDSEAHGEVIRSSAFNRTIAQRDDIRLLVNHDGVPLARTKSGTLEVGVDDHGLWFDAPSLDPANPRVQELTSAMARQDIDQCSFAGYFTDVKRGQGGVDEVCEVKAIDVSIVTYPWYDETSAGLTGRADVDRALLAVRSLDAEERATVWATVDICVENEAPEPADVADVADVAADNGAAGTCCPSCGAMCPADASYCSACGTHQGRSAEAPTAESDPAPVRTFKLSEARALLRL